MTAPVKVSSYYYDPEAGEQIWIKEMPINRLEIAKAYFSDATDTWSRKDFLQPERYTKGLAKLLDWGDERNTKFCVKMMHRHRLSNIRSAISDHTLAKSRSELIRANKEAIRDRQKQKAEQFADYIRAIRKQRKLLSLVNNWLKIDEEAPLQLPINETNDGLIIADENIPLLKTFCRLLARPLYCRGKRPEEIELFENHLKVRSCREKAIQQIRSNPNIKEYFLYDDGVLVAEKRDDRFTILDQEKYLGCLKVPEQTEMWRKTTFPRITPLFIDKVIRLGYIPGRFRIRLERFLDERVYAVFCAWNPCTGSNSKNNLRKKEVKILEYDMQCMFLEIDFFLQRDMYNQCRGHFQEDDTTLDKGKFIQLYRYLDGQQPLEKIKFTTENARAYLTLVKLFDLAVRGLNRYRMDDKLRFRSTYRLRSHLLKIAPDLKSHEAYTLTPHKELLKDPDYLSQPRHWISTRVGMQAKIVLQTLIAVRLSSESLTSVLATRGNTAAGKSVFAPRNSLNPDNFKAFLKRNGEERLLNIQVYEEGTNLFWRFFKEITKGTVCYSLDARLIETEYLESNVINPAKSRKVAAKITDFEVSLSTSLMRVLARPVYGEDPCPSLEPIVSGYIQLRQYRHEIIDRIKNNATVTDYQLLYKNSNGDVILVARKKEGIFEILDDNLFAESLHVPLNEEIVKQVDQIITPQLIEKAIAEKDIRENQRIQVERWIGYSLADAINLHAAGVV